MTATFITNFPSPSPFLFTSVTRTQTSKLSIYFAITALPHPPNKSWHMTTWQPISLLPLLPPSYPQAWKTWTQSVSPRQALMRAGEGWASASCHWKAGSLWNAAEIKYNNLKAFQSPREPRVRVHYCARISKSGWLAVNDINHAPTQCDVEAFEVSLSKFLGDRWKTPGVTCGPVLSVFHRTFISGHFFDTFESARPCATFLAFKNTYLTGVWEVP